MRVLQVCGSFWPALEYGGPIRSMYELCRGLGRRGCDVRVITTDANGPDRGLDVELDRWLPLSPNVEVRYCHRVAMHTLSPTMVRRMPEAVRWADVVHLHSVYSSHIPLTLASVRLWPRPLVWSTRGAFQRWHGSTMTIAKSLWNKSVRPALGEPMTFHATAEAEAQDQRDQLGEVPSVIIPNGVSVPDVLPERTTTGDRLEILFLGRLDPIKALDHLLEACNRLEVPWRLSIAGSGAPHYDKELDAMIAGLDLGARVRRVGFVDGEDKTKLFRASDVLVLCSHRENFGMVVAEALAHQVPVIASHGTPWAELEDRGCGLWVDNAAESLSDALTAVWGMDREQMGERGRVWMQASFSWDSVADAFIRAYESLNARVGAATEQLG